jgi:hypothetical protein
VAAVANSRRTGASAIDLNPAPRARVLLRCDARILSVREVSP